MPCFRVDVDFTRTKSFYVQAENPATVWAFLDSVDPEWDPSEVEGLVERVSDESRRLENIFADEQVEPAFAIDDDFNLVELDPA